MAQLVTSVTTFGTVRTDSQSSVGFQFIAAAAITVSQLGRWDKTGSSGTHTLTLYDTVAASVIASVSITNSGSNAFRYGTLSSPVTLVSGRKYSVESSEGGGDGWYDHNTVLAYDAAIGDITNAVFGHTSTDSTDGHSYGVLDLTTAEANTILPAIINNPLMS
jgi:hypothetical protein